MAYGASYNVINKSSKFIINKIVTKKSKNLNKFPVTTYIT